MPCHHDDQVLRAGKRTIQVGSSDFVADYPCVPTVSPDGGWFDFVSEATVMRCDMQSGRCTVLGTCGYERPIDAVVYGDATVILCRGSDGLVLRRFGADGRLGDLRLADSRDCEDLSWTEQKAIWPEQGLVACLHQHRIRSWDMDSGAELPSRGWPVHKWRSAFGNTALLRWAGGLMIRPAGDQEWSALIGDALAIPAAIPAPFELRQDGRVGIVRGERELVVYDLDTAAPLFRLPGVWSHAAFTPQGDIVTTAMARIMVWDGSTGLPRWDDDDRLQSPVCSLALAQDGSRLVLAGGERLLSTALPEVAPIALSLPAGARQHHVVACSSRSIVTCLSTFDHTRPSGEMYRDLRVVSWEPGHRLRELHALPPGDCPIPQLAVEFDRGLLAVGNRGLPYVDLVSLTDGRLVKRLATDAAPGSLAFPPGRPWLFIGSASAAIVTVVDIERVETIASLRSPVQGDEFVQELAVSPDGGLLAVVSGCRSDFHSESTGPTWCTVWELPGLKQRAHWSSWGGEDIMFTPDGCAIRSMRGGRLYEMALDEEEPRQIATLADDCSWASSADGRIFATGHRDGTARVYGHEEATDA